MTRKIIIPLVLLLGTLRATAQGNGSSSYYTNTNSLYVQGGTTFADVSQSTFVGAPETVDGTLQVYSHYVYLTSAISTDNIGGRGAIYFNSPGSVGGADGLTYIDGNGTGTLSTGKVYFQNTNGTALADISNPGFTTGDAANNATLTVDSLSIDSSFLYINSSVNTAIPTLGNTVVNNGSVANDLIVTAGNGGSITSANGIANHYVVTSDSIRGHVVAQDIPANTAFLFPVGRYDITGNGDYTPATITPASTATIHVSVTDYAAATGNYGISINSTYGMDRAWNIYADAAVAPTIMLQHNDATNGGDYLQAISYITQYQGGLWSTSSTDFVSDNPAINTTAKWTLATSATAAQAWLSKTSNLTNALPVGILSFQATKQGGTALLQWTTASEINNKGFEIQRSTDGGKTWSNIGFVNSQAVNGNSSSALNYSYTDNTPANGVNYYRIEQVSLSGNTTLSNVVPLDFGVQATVYPNPANAQLNVTIAANCSYQLIDIIGRTLLTGNLQAGKNTISVGSVPSGTYLLRLTANGSASVFKILIRR